MVEPGETVSSDVHVKCKSTNLEDGVNPILVSRFPFRVRGTTTTTTVRGIISGGIQLRGKAAEDETTSTLSGRDDVDSDVVIIRHFLQTSLKEVSCRIYRYGPTEMKL